MAGRSKRRGGKGGGAVRPGGGGRGDGRRGDGAHVSWLHANRPILRFVGVFALAIGMFFAVMATSTMRHRVFPAYLRANAVGSAAVLRVFGRDARAEGNAVVAPGCSLQIEKGCDAVDPTALLLAAMLAFPAPLRSKLGGMVLGTLALAAINFARIVLLFYVQLYWPDWFHVMHVDVFQVAFIALALIFWLAWAMWSTRDRKRKPDVDVATG